MGGGDNRAKGIQPVGESPKSGGLAPNAAIEPSIERVPTSSNSEMPG